MRRSGSSPARSAFGLGLAIASLVAAAPAAQAGHLVITGVTVMTTVVANGENTITIRRGGRIEVSGANGIVSMGDFTKLRVYPGSEIVVTNATDGAGMQSMGAVAKVENRGRIDVTATDNAAGVLHSFGSLDVKNWGGMYAQSEKFAVAVGNVGPITTVQNWGTLAANAGKFAAGVLGLNEARAKVQVRNWGEIEAYAGIVGEGLAFGVAAVSAGPAVAEVQNIHGHIEASADKFAAGVAAFSQNGSARASVINTGRIEAYAGNGESATAFGVASFLGFIPFNGSPSFDATGVARTDVLNWGTIEASAEKFAAGVAAFAIPGPDSLVQAQLNVTNYGTIGAYAGGGPQQGGAIAVFGLGQDIQSRVTNWGRIWARGEKFGVGVAAVGNSGRSHLTNYGYIGGRAKKFGAGVVAVNEGSIRNWGTIEGFSDDPPADVDEGGFGILFQAFGPDRRLRVENYGAITGNSAAIQQIGPGRLIYSGTIAGLNGPIRGSEIPGEQLTVKLYFVPKEAKKALLARRGEHSEPWGFHMAGVPLRIENFDTFSVEEIISGEEVARDGLDEFGRALDYTHYDWHGPESFLHGGLAQIASTHDWRALNEAFETASGRAQHQMASDHAFQLTTERSVDLQRYFDRAHDRRNVGMHGGALMLTMDPRTSQQFLTSGLDRKLYAEYTGGRVILADVIDEPAEAAPPRRRMEPTEPPPPGKAAPPAPQQAAPPAAVEERPVWSAFLSGLGMFADQDATGNRVNSDWSAAGPTIGMDRLLDNGVAVGLLASYFRTEGDTDDFGSEFEADSYSLGTYATWGAPSGWHASLAAYYTYHRYEQERQITVPGFSVEAESDPDGHQFTTYLSGGYDLRLGDERSPWVIGPYAALQHSLLDIGSYDESGAGPLNLQYDDQLANSLQTHLGLRLTREWRCDWGGVSPEVRAAWVHEFMDDDRSIGTQTNGPAIPPWDVETTLADRDFFIVGGSLSLTLERWRQLHFFAGYDARLGQDDYIAHAASAGVSLDF